MALTPRATSTPRPGRDHDPMPSHDHDRRPTRVFPSAQSTDRDRSRNRKVLGEQRTEFAKKRPGRSRLGKHQDDAVELAVTLLQGESCREGLPIAWPGLCLDAVVPRAMGMGN